MARRHHHHRKRHHHHRKRYNNFRNYNKKYHKPKNNNGYHTPKKSMSIRYKILFGVLILNVILYFSNLIPFIIVFDFIFLIIWLWGYTRSCPKCKSHFAKRLRHRDHLGTHTEFENVSKRVNHRNPNGEIVGYSTYNTTRPVTRHTIQNHWRCKFCGNEWSGRIHDI